jgi:hypothetical protein
MAALRRRVSVAACAPGVREPSKYLLKTRRSIGLDRAHLGALSPPAIADHPPHRQDRHTQFQVSSTSLKSQILLAHKGYALHIASALQRRPGVARLTRRAYLAADV